MNRHYNDYNQSCFKVEKKDGKIKYFLKVKGKYIEVSEDVFHVCRSSFDKMRYIYKQEVAQSVTYFDDIDSATFFVTNKQYKNPIDELIYKDMAEYIKNEINMLPEIDKKIAILLFIEERSIREVADFLNIPHTTVAYRKKRIIKEIRKKFKKVCTVAE